MAPSRNNRSRDELLREARQARQEADTFHRASLMTGDGVVVESLVTRAQELNKLARQLETQAAGMTRSADDSRDLLKRLLEVLFRV